MEQQIDIINIKNEYETMLKSGMFFEFYPECSGTWENDKEIFVKKFFERYKNMKENKIEQNNGENPQINYYQVDNRHQLQLLDKEGFQLNPNEKVVNSIVKRIFKNDGECPCHNESYDKKCPCSDFREKDICHCGLYVRKE